MLRFQSSGAWRLAGLLHQRLHSSVGNGGGMPINSGSTIGAVGLVSSALVHSGGCSQWQLPAVTEQQRCFSTTTTLLSGIPAAKSSSNTATVAKGGKGQGGNKSRGGTGSKKRPAGKKSSSGKSAGGASTTRRTIVIESPVAAPTRRGAAATASRGGGGGGKDTPTGDGTSLQAAELLHSGEPGPEQLSVDQREAMESLALKLHKKQQERVDGTGTAVDFTSTLLAEFRRKFKEQFPRHFRLRLAVAEELAGANIVIPTGFKGQRVVLPAIAMRAECHDRRYSETRRQSQLNKNGSKKKSRGDKNVSELSTLSWLYMPADTEQPLLRRVYSGKSMDKVRKTAVSDFQRAVPDYTLLT